MRQALALAESAGYLAEPNPRVGAILVDAQGEVLAQGFHALAGGPHAEVEALKDFASLPPEATLFVTLEPCNHQGKTPPCTEFLIQKKLRHLVIGCLDPNPRVSGKGVARLREAGMEVTQGVLEDECRRLNERYNRYIRKGMPFIALKAGVSLDGKIAMASGESQWVTSTEARAKAHQLRSQFQAIMIGKKTLLADNPRLDNRIDPAPRQPIPIVIGQPLIQAGLNFFQDQRKKYWLASSAYGDFKEELLKFNIEAIDCQAGAEAGLKALYQQGIASLLVEGGARLASSLLRLGLVDELILFMAPRLIGQADAPGFCG